jgi:hypothetical protein
MTTSIGITSAMGKIPASLLPLGWIGLANMPQNQPSWASFSALSSTQCRNLIAQISYETSSWNYSLLGAGNQLGAYQFTTQELEDFGVLAAGANAAYGNECVFYKASWVPSVVKNPDNSFANYIFNITTLNLFLNHTTTQDYLAYQKLSNLYTALVNNGAILSTDAPDVVAGMINVAWNLGPGTASTYSNVNGTGAYAWRFFNQGAGALPYNEGRYAVTVLSQ